MSDKKAVVIKNKGVKYLQKRGTNLVFVRTPGLVKKGGFDAVSWEEAQKLIAKKEAADKARAGAIDRELDAEASKEGVTADAEAENVAEVESDEQSAEAESDKLEASIIASVESMDEEQLRAKAEELKIRVGGKWGIEAIKKNIIKTMLKDSQPA